MALTFGPAVVVGSVNLDVRLGLPLLDAMAAATSRPADLLARPGLGRIKVGRACRSGVAGRQSRHKENIDRPRTSVRHPKPHGFLKAIGALRLGHHFPRHHSGDTTR